MSRYSEHLQSEYDRIFESRPIRDELVGRDDLLDAIGLVESIIRRAGPDRPGIEHGQRALDELRRLHTALKINTREAGR